MSKVGTNTPDATKGAHLSCTISRVCPRHSTNLGVEVSAHSLLSPRLEVELGTAFLFWVTHHISHSLREKGEERTNGTGLLRPSPKMLKFQFLSACDGDLIRKEGLCR